MKTNNRARLLAGAALALLVLMPALAEAQQRGRVRIQGRDTEQRDVAPPPLPVIALDPREEMRRFVQSIRGFSRRYARNFLIITQNGLDLLAKIDDTDDTRKSPARTYMGSIDGVLQEGLFYGIPEFDVATATERREVLLGFTELAKANGLKVMVVDYGVSPQTIRESQRLNAARGHLSILAQARGPELNQLPAYLKRPPGENPNSIVTLADVRNFVYLRDSATFGRQDQFALKLHQTNFDLIVVDVFHRVAEPLTKRAVATLKFKKIGARRLVLAYLNIGAAASYRYYWKPYWREGSPLWINAPYPGNPDQYYVEYWSPEWQQIITGDTDSYIYGIINQGFDGVVLDGVEAFRFFEGGTEVVEATR